jgi:hypothetical protein
MTKEVAKEERRKKGRVGNILIYYINIEYPISYKRKGQARSTLTTE